MNVSSPYGVGGLGIFLVGLLGWAFSRVEPYDPTIDVVEIVSTEPPTLMAAAEAASVDVEVIKNAATTSVNEAAQNAEEKMADVVTTAKDTVTEKAAEAKEVIPAIEATATDLAKATAAAAGTSEAAASEAAIVNNEAVQAVAETATKAEAKLEDTAKAAEAIIADEAAMKDSEKVTESAVVNEPKTEIALSAPVAVIVPPPSAKPWVGAKLGDELPIVGVIVDNSPAATAGLKPGDVIESVNGEKIANTKELVSKIVASKPGDKLELVITRVSESVPIVLTLGTNPATSSAAPAK